MPQRASSRERWLDPQFRQIRATTRPLERGTRLVGSGPSEPARPDRARRDGGRRRDRGDLSFRGPRRRADVPRRGGCARAARPDRRHATEQLGARLGSGGASVVQSALGNLPELFIALFALNKGLVEVVQAALVGSILANSVLVLGIAFIVGGLQARPADVRLEPGATGLDLDGARRRDDGDPVARARVPRPGGAHGEALSLVCAGVLLVLFVLTLPSFLAATAGEEHAPARWSKQRPRSCSLWPARAAAFTSDWFVDALTPAIHTLHMSRSSPAS